ncbi:MAG: TPM domain-containing protein [Pseudomonadota bacterium]
MKRLSAALALLLLMTLSAWAQLAVPPLSGRVVDQANIIDAKTEGFITNGLSVHQQKSGNQIAVLTIPSLQGESLEQYSLKVARTWALGTAEFNNGALLLIAKNDRKLRIEVGYGLEGTLTDAIASVIIRQRITPAFKKGNFSQGIDRGVRAMVEVLEADAAALQRWKDRAKPSVSYDVDNGEIIVLFFFIVWFFIIFGSLFIGLLTRWFGREVKPGHYRWMGFDAGPNAPRPKRRRNSSGGWLGGSSGGFSSGGGFSGGGGSFGGGGSSGSW